MSKLCVSAYPWTHKTEAKVYFDLISGEFKGRCNVCGRSLKLRRAEEVNRAFYTIIGMLVVGFIIYYAWRIL